MNFSSSINNFLKEESNSFPFHKKLFDKFWTDYRINTKVREYLLQIAKDELIRIAPYNIEIQNYSLR